MKSSHVLCSTITAFAVAACGVPQERYDWAVRDARHARNDKTQCDGDLARSQSQAKAASAAVASAQALIERQNETISANERELQYRQARFDGAAAENMELRKELVRLGKNVDAMLTEKGSVSGALADARARLDELLQPNIDELVAVPDAK